MGELLKIAVWLGAVDVFWVTIACIPHGVFSGPFVLSNLLQPTCADSVEMINTFQQSIAVSQQDQRTSFQSIENRLQNRALGRRVQIGGRLVEDDG